MNKKVLIIILSIVVLGIWFKVIAKIFNQWRDEETAVIGVQSGEIVDLSKFIKRDTIPEPMLEYRDPFLGEKKRVTRKRIKNVQSNTPEIRRVRNRSNGENEEITPWPQIKYHGFVKVSGTDSGTLLLKVNGQIYKVREGEQLNNEFTIKKAFRDSILIVRNEEIKTFYK